MKEIKNLKITRKDPQTVEVTLEFEGQAYATLYAATEGEEPSEDTLRADFETYQHCWMKGRPGAGGFLKQDVK